MYARRLQPLLRELLAEFRIVYLTGPRQAGKTTLARSVSRDLGLEYVTLDDQATLASVQSDPHGFVRSLGDKRAVLDEFQYVPALIPAIKEISDRLDPHEKGKFLLTGSADIFRSARTQESLPGHMVRLELLPLSVTELYGQPLNVIDHLSAGEFTHVPAASATREDVANLVLRGGYPEVQGKSRRGRQASYSIRFSFFLDLRLRIEIVATDTAQQFRGEAASSPIHFHAALMILGSLGDFPVPPPMKVAGRGRRR